MVIVVVMSVISLGAWTAIVSRSARFARKVHQHEKQISDLASTRLERIGTGLADNGCERGAEQARLLSRKMEALREVLEHRLVAGELAFGRYLSAAEQVYLNGIDALGDVEVLLSATRGMNEPYVRTRLAELAGPGHAGEREALEERLALYEEHVQKVEERLGYNETLMTALDATTAGLAATRMGGEQATVDPTTALDALVRMASMTKHYAQA